MPFSLIAREYGCYLYLDIDSFFLLYGFGVGCFLIPFSLPGRHFLCFSFHQTSGPRLMGCCNGQYIRSAIDIVCLLAVQICSSTGPPAGFCCGFLPVLHLLLVFVTRQTLGAGGFQQLAGGAVFAVGTFGGAEEISQLRLGLAGVCGSRCRWPPIVSRTCHARISPGGNAEFTIFLRRSSTPKCTRGCAHGPCG